MTEVQTPEVDERPSVVEALIKVMSEVRTVAKDQTMSAGPGGTFKFRGIDQILTAVKPLLKRHGVMFVPTLIQPSYAEVLVGKDRRPTREVTLLVTYQVYGPRGDWIETTVPAESLDSGDKGTAKAMSVALRTVLIQVLAIPTGDPDPDSQVYERSYGQPRYDRSGPGGSVVSPDPVDVENVLEAILTAFEEAAVIRGWDGEQKTTAMRNYIENSLGVKNVWDDKAGILWDKVSPGQKAIMLQACRKTLADLRGQSSPL